MASSAKSKIGYLDPKHFPACSQALAVVIFCSNLGDNIWHTAQEYYDAVKSRNGSAMRGLEIDLDSLKRAMTFAPCLPWLCKNGYIAYSTMYDRDKDSVIKGEFDRGRQMMITHEYHFDGENLTRAHQGSVSGLQNQLFTLCNNPSLTSQPKKSSPAPKKTHVSSSKTPQKLTPRAQQKKRLHRNVVTVSSSKSKGVVASRIQEQDSEEEVVWEDTEKVSYDTAFLIVVKALKKEVEDYASLRAPKKKNDDDNDGMAVDEEEEDEWEDSDTKFPFTRRLPLFQNLLTVLTSSPSFTKENKTAQNNVDKWATKQRDALLSLCEEKKAEKEAQGRERKAKKSISSGARQSTMLLRLTRVQRCEAVLDMYTRQLELAKEAVLLRHQQFAKKARLVELLLQQSDNVRRNGGPRPNSWATGNGMTLFYGATRAIHEHFSQVGLAICSTTAAKKATHFRGRFNTQALDYVKKYSRDGEHIAGVVVDNFNHKTFDNNCGEDRPLCRVIPTCTILTWKLKRVELFETPPAHGNGKGKKKGRGGDDIAALVRINNYPTCLRPVKGIEDLREMLTDWDSRVDDKHQDKVDALAAYHHLREALPLKSFPIRTSAYEPMMKMHKVINEMATKEHWLVCDTEPEASLR